MNTDTLKLVLSYVTALGIIAGTYYALVIYPYVLDADVKLWLTGAAGGALAFVFGDQIATRSAQQTTDAIYTMPPSPSVTVSAGPPATATVETIPPPEEESNG